MFSRQIDFGILHPCVVNFAADTPLENLQTKCPELGLFQPDRIEAVTRLVLCDEITVSVVRTAQHRQTTTVSPEQLEKVLSDLLHNVVLAPHTVIHLGDCPLAVLYHVDRIYVHDCGSNAQLVSEAAEIVPIVAWTVSRQSTRINLKHQVSATFVDALQSTSRVPRIAGVDLTYSAVRSAVQQRREHLLLSGPVGVGKSTLVRCIAAELRVPFLSADCGDLCEGEQQGLAGLFATARQV